VNPLDTVYAYPLAILLLALTLCIVLIGVSVVAIWSPSEQRRSSARDILQLMVRLFYPPKR